MKMAKDTRQDDRADRHQLACCNRPTVDNIVIGARNEEQLRAKPRRPSAGTLSTDQVKKLDGRQRDAAHLSLTGHQRQDTRLKPAPRNFT